MFRFIYVSFARCRLTLELLRGTNERFELILYFQRHHGLPMCILLQATTLSSQVQSSEAADGTLQLSAFDYEISARHHAH